MDKIPRYRPFLCGIHLTLVNSPHKGQWRGALMFSLICAWTNGSANNRDAGDLRRHPIHCDVIVMTYTWVNICMSKMAADIWHMYFQMYFVVRKNCILIQIHIVHSMFIKLRKRWRATAWCGKSKFTISSGWLTNGSLCHPDDIITLS